MKNLLAKKSLSEQFAEGVGEITKWTIIAIIAFLFVIAKLIKRFAKWEWRFIVIAFMLINLYTTFIRYASAPKVDASQPFQNRIVVTLPMRVTPNLKLREAVLSLVKDQLGEDQVTSFDNIITHESGWDAQAINPNGGACGLGQSLPCSKVINACGSLDNVACQAGWVINYVVTRYGTPNAAWKFWQTKHLINGKWVNYY